MYNKKCCIVIPVYKKELSVFEKASLNQVIKTIPDFAFYLVCANGFDAINYSTIFSNNKCDFLNIERFDDKYFSSLEGYNKLLISKTFYQRFSNFEFMLIYQLDAWVFKNELDYWCNKNFNYIGAPWFKDYYKATDKSPFLGVGNGGLSLRKINTYLKFLEAPKRFFPFSILWKVYLKELIKNYLKGISINSTVYFLKSIVTKNNTFSLLENFNYQEDYFWGIVMPKAFAWYKVPDKTTASKFSMEVNAPILFEINNKELPFGCHAWEKYNADFWSKYIII